MILSGLGCRLQTCSCLATEWFNSTFRAVVAKRLNFSLSNWTYFACCPGSAPPACTWRGRCGFPHRKLSFSVTPISDCRYLFPPPEYKKPLQKMEKKSSTQFWDIGSLEIILDLSPSIAYSFSRLLTHLFNHACSD